MASAPNNSCKCLCITGISDIVRYVAKEWQQAPTIVPIIHPPISNLGLDTFAWGIVKAIKELAPSEATITVFDAGFRTIKMHKTAAVAIEHCNMIFFVLYVFKFSFSGFIYKKKEGIVY